MKHLILAATMACAAVPVSADSHANISVTGQGEVSLTPDMARISVGVTAQDDEAAEAIAQMNAALAAVLGRITESGTPAEDISTSGLRLDVQQDFSSSSGRGQITGYVAQSTVQVTVRDLDTLGDVLGQAVVDGANTIDGLTFDVADRAPHLEEARRRAVADAAARAQLYADAAGVTLGDLMALTEGGAAPGPQPMQARAFDESMSVPVAPGQITIGASVAMTYAIAN